MSTSSNVPALTITDTGVVVPQTSDVLNGVLDDMNVAFGGNLNITNPGTPQGYFAENITNYIGNFNAQVSYLLSQIDPLYAEGRWQDAIGRLYFLTRNPATSTTVTCQLSGSANVTIPAGALASDGTYNYSLTGNVVLNSSGSGTGVFACTTTGPISCPANTLTKIVQAYPGWDSVNNSAEGSVGVAVENRTDFEYRRYDSVSANGKDTLASIKGAVFSLEGIKDCYAYENFTGASVNVGATNYPVAAHSIYVAVDGSASDNTIANAIWTKKPAGCGMVGSTTVTVTDTSGYTFPYPTYTIKFQRAAGIPIYFAVSIADHPGVPANIDSLVQSAIYNSFNGIDGSDRVRIGSDLYASKFYSAVMSISPYVKIISLFIGTTSSPTSNEVLIGIDKIPTLDTAHIAVSIV